MLTFVPASRRTSQSIDRFGKIDQPTHERRKLRSSPLDFRHVHTISLIQDHWVSADKWRQLFDTELCVSPFRERRRKSVWGGHPHFQKSMYWDFIPKQYQPFQGVGGRRRNRDISLRARAVMHCFCRLPKKRSQRAYINGK